MIGLMAATLPQQPRSDAVYVLTPLLRGIGCVLSWTTASETRLDESFVRGVSGQSMRCTIAIFEVNVHC